MVTVNTWSATFKEQSYHLHYLHHLLRQQRTTEHTMAPSEVDPHGLVPVFGLLIRRLANDTMDASNYLISLIHITAVSPECLDAPLPQELSHWGF